MMDKGTLIWIKKLIKDNELDKFYNCRRWRKLRQEALKRDKNECQTCKAKGIYKSAQDVHHVEEVKLNPQKALDIKNLTSLCKVCHNTLHDKVKNMHTLSNKNKFTNIERW